MTPGERKPGSGLIGTTVGSYRVAELIGSGGMGAVYRLVHPSIGKELALKVLHPEFATKPEILRRFFDEARAANHIDHPSIIDVIDFGTLDDGSHYMTMEFLEGESLGQRLARTGALPPAMARDILLPVCGALDLAHRHGIYHRDLKPDNLFLCRDGRVKILDFGIAKLTGSIRSGDFPTLSGSIIGTPKYMAPEQALGQVRNINGRTDIYALGIILFEILAGRAPFDGNDMASIIDSHVHSPLPSLGVFRGDLGASWDPVLRLATAKDPDHRFSGAGDFAAAVADLAQLAPSTPVRSKTPVMPGVTRHLPKDAHRWPTATLAGIALAVLLAVAAVLITARLL